jgi:hypothetical protein
MIDYTKIKQYLIEELKYKPKIEIMYYRIVGDKIIDIKFDNGMGEIISLEKYSEWIQKKRGECIKEILK